MTSISFKSYKHAFMSRILNRDVHADVFELGSEPSRLVVFFGGSGIDEEEYARRGKSIVPIFDPLLESLAASDLNLAFMYVTAPYDVPFARFADFPDEKEKWNEHILEELIAPWQQFPVFLAAFSGGAALAFHGIHQSRRCCGGAAMGADGVPADFVCPEHWNAMLRLYAAPNDRVCHNPRNRELFEGLMRRGQVEELEMPFGEHRLADYIENGSVEDVLRFAATVQLAN